jgi:hypothetical protein
LCVTVASAHDFYDPECCHDQDCAPVTRIEKTENGDLMTTKHGTILVNPSTKNFMKKISPDENYHVCQRIVPDENGGPAFHHLLCVYYPAQY